MKSFAFVAVAAIAAVSHASAAKCVLTDLVGELEPITAMVYACYDATGYAVIPPRANPTAEQTAAVCAKCPEMITTAKTMTFNTCYFTVSGVDIPLNEWVPKITGACDATSTSTSASAGSASSAAPAVGSTTNSTTATTTSAPSTAAASTSSGSGSSASATSNSVTAPAPSPTATESAGVVASLSVATTAVAVGSIAAFLL